MATITDAEIKLKGLSVLIQALGEVDAERFIMLLNREPFNYTEWQKEILSGMNVNEISKRAMEMRRAEKK
jgi:hypothetical protein